jgi:hypothetical protein
MSIDMKMTAQGFPELFQAMDELAEEIGKGKTDKIWRNAMSFAIEPVLQDAKSFAPEDTGQLAKHIYSKVHRPQARDKTSQSYQGEMYIARVTASTLRDDVIHKVILNKRGKFQTVVGNKKPVPVSQEFGNARVSAKPFLRPALESNYDNVISRLGQAIWSELQWGKYNKSKS